MYPVSLPCQNGEFALSAASTVSQGRSRSTTQPTTNQNPEREILTMASLRPLDDRVVLKVLEAEEMSAGGILLPDAAKEKPQRGKVTAVGAGKLTKDGKRVKPDVKSGEGEMQRVGAGIARRIVQTAGRTRSTWFLG